VPIMIRAPPRAPPPIFLSNDCEITERSDSDSMERTMSFSAAGTRHDTVDGLGRGTGVQRSEHQMTGLGGGQRETDGFEVAQFANQDHVRIFAQRRAQGVVEAERVAPTSRWLIRQFLLVCTNSIGLRPSGYARGDSR